MRYHFPVFFPCEGTSETTPCTHGPSGKGMVAMGIMKVSDPGVNGAAFHEAVPPDGWSPLRISPPSVLGASKPKMPDHPFASPWAWAHASQTKQGGMQCPKCAEHSKMEDMVKDAAKAQEEGKLQ